MDEPSLDKSSSPPANFSDANSNPSNTSNSKPCSVAMEPAARKSAANVPHRATPRTEFGTIPSPVPLKKRKKTRRGKRNSKKFCKVATDKTFDIFHTNIRGLNSKKLSFKSIYERINPSVITINEVGLKKDKKLSLPGYYSYNKNRIAKIMGGVATAIKKDEAGFALKIAEGNDKSDEFIITRHAQFVNPINILNIYGMQEGRNSTNEIEDGWNTILEYIDKIEKSNEETIIIGDLNKLVGNGEFGVKGNNPKVSFGGHLIHKSLKDGKFILLNNSDKCSGGPFTRIDPSNPNIKSCLDLCIISRGLLKFVVEMIIDDERKFTPHRATSKKITYTDHFSLHIKFQGIPEVSKSYRMAGKILNWNTRKEDGWKKYFQFTTNNERLDNLARSSEELSTNEMVEKITTVMNKIKFQSFGKIKISNGAAKNRELDELYRLKSKAIDEKNENEALALESKIREELVDLGRKEFEKKLKYLENIQKEKGGSAAVFKLKEQIMGSKKAGQEAVCMEDPETGEIIVERGKLKEASVRYVANLLTNRDPKEEYKREFKIMEKLHDIRSMEQSSEEIKLTEEDFKNLLKHLSGKNKGKYQFIIKAGKSYQNLLFELFKKIWESERKPDSWKNTMCHQLYKGKGEKKEFCNQRFIHSKEDIPKAFEQIVISKAKPKIVKNCTKFQIGAIPGHQPAEHLFTIKSIISYFKMKDAVLILQCFDIRKYFDSENLKDAMNSLYCSGVDGKLYNLIYELNKSNRIQIKTSVGVSNRFEVGPTVAQGSIGGGLISSCNLDYSVNKYFRSSSSEVFYHDLKLQPLIYQDDLGRFSTSVQAAQDGTKKIESCMESKLLDLHSDKSCFMIFGNERKKKAVHDELDANPIKLYDEPMKEKLKEKYLGDFIHSDGNSASVQATVNDRYGRILVGTFEIRQIIEDCRSKQVGGITAGIQLWESAHIPSLLNNCKTWVEISDDTLSKLEELQNKFYRNLLNVPRTTPKPALIWELGGLKMKWRIIQEKLVFMNHILHLDSSSLARQVQIIQDQENLPGLSQECKLFIEQLELPNLFEEYHSKQKWKTLVKHAVKKANEKEVLEAMVGYKKLKNRKIVNDKFGLKPYAETLSLYETRLVFKHRASMSQFVKMNYKGSKKYTAEGWKCEECLELDTEDHLIWCSGYKDFRDNLNLESDKDLATYLHRIFIKRSDKKSGTSVQNLTT